MNKVLFSIIIPVYNVENYIYKTVNSIINQSFKDFEAILVNDGSTDNSIAIAEGLLMNSDIDYKIINLEHQSASTARNKGMSVASGKYLYFLDSDNFVDTDFLKTVEKEMRDKELDIAFWNFDKVDENYKIIQKYQQEFINHQEILTGKQLFIAILKERVGFQLSSAIYRRQLIEESNIKFYECCCNGIDQEFYLKAVYKAEKTMYLDKEFFHYLKRNNNLANGVNLNILNISESFSRLTQYLEGVQADKNFISITACNKWPKEIITNYNRMLASAAKPVDIQFDEDVKRCLKRFKMWQFNFKELKCFIGIHIFLINKNIYTAIYKQFVRLRKLPAFSIVKHMPY